MAIPLQSMLHVLPVRCGSYTRIPMDSPSLLSISYGTPLKPIEVHPQGLPSSQYYRRIFGCQCDPTECSNITRLFGPIWSTMNTLCTLQNERAGAGAWKKAKLQLLELNAHSQPSHPCWCNVVRIILACSEIQLRFCTIRTVFVQIKRYICNIL